MLIDLFIRDTGKWSFYWWARQDSNLGPRDYESLPSKLICFNYNQLRAPAPRKRDCK